MLAGNWRAYQPWGMPMRVLVCLAMLMIAGPAVGQHDPLFQSDEPIKVTIKGPFKRLMADRSYEEENGTFTYIDTDGNPHELSVKIQIRGKFRRNPKVCDFAPLRLEFKKSEVKDTLFDKQDKLKMVTHCDTRSTRHTQSLLREYLAYRVLNMLTEKSFRVRFLEVTYEESEAKRRPISEYGFLIEHKKRLGKRIDAKPVDGIDRIKVGQLHGDYMNLTSVFQFFIANLDFSAVASAEEGSCCHNQTLFGEGEDLYYSIPYDFDMSGFVRASYAKPNPAFKVRSITTRVYRGRCVNNEHLAKTVALFQANRENIDTLVGTFPLLSKMSQRQLQKLIRDFFKIVDDPKLLERQIIGECLAP